MVFARVWHTCPRMGVHANGDLIDLDGRRNLTAMRRGGLVLKSIDPWAKPT